MPYEIDDDKLSHIITLFGKQVFPPFITKHKSSGCNSPENDMNV